MAGSKQNKRPNNPKPKRPPLTHFLCLPLVNDVSLPQLEASLASFKASIPPALPETQGQEQGQQQPRPLIPNDAIRPVGTLHLTLGVMSLQTPERLEQALQFFNSLDLAALMRKANEVAAQKRLREARKGTSASKESTENEEKDSAVESGASSGAALGPDSIDSFTISLESIHALKGARAARVLHAAPVDQTSRLYPFCEALRDMFIEAGFLEGEYKSEPKKAEEKSGQKSEDREAQNSPQAQDQDHNQTDLAAPEPTTAGEPKGKRRPRPLLLHATIANMIYSRGGQRDRKGQGKKSQRPGQDTFDARDIIAHYRNFYLDSDRTIPRSSGGVIVRSQSESQSGIDKSNKTFASEDRSKGDGGEPMASAESERTDAAEGSRQDKDTSNDGKVQGYPFVWARNFPIEAVSICEMGAKKLNPAAGETGMKARLGQKYIPVASRSLDFRNMEQS